MKYVGILAATALVIVGFIYYMLFAAPAYEMTDRAAESTAQYEVSETKDNARNIEPRQGFGTLTELRLLGDNLECTVSFTDEENNTVVEGTYFVSENNMRGDFLTDAPDLSGQVLTSMIIKDNISYVWSEIEGQTYGMKVDLSLAESAAVDTNEPIDPDAVVKYDCKPWPNVDGTVFEPPRGVLFQDMSALLRSGMEYGTIYE